MNSKLIAFLANGCKVNADYFKKVYVSNGGFFDDDDKILFIMFHVSQKSEVKQNSRSKLPEGFSFKELGESFRDGGYSYRRERISYLKNLYEYSLKCKMGYDIQDSWHQLVMWASLLNNDISENCINDIKIKNSAEAKKLLQEVVPLTFRRDLAKETLGFLLKNFGLWADKNFIEEWKPKFKLAVRVCFGPDGIFKR